MSAGNAKPLRIGVTGGPGVGKTTFVAALAARLGLPVKMMIGGVTGWIDEGFTLTPS